MLQPVAGNDRRAAAADRGIVGLDELAGVHVLEAFVARQHRLFLGRAQIGEDQAVALLDRIPGLAHLVAMRAAVGLAGLLEAMALDVEQPAVIAAADAALLDLAVVERGAAMAQRGCTRPGSAVPSRNRIRSSPSTRTFRGVRSARPPARPDASSGAAARPSACRDRPRSSRFWNSEFHFISGAVIQPRVGWVHRDLSCCRCLSAARLPGFVLPFYRG